MFQNVEKMMRKAEALKLLTLHKPEFIRRFGITDLVLFGSTARDEARPDSDIDVGVIRPELKPYVEKDLIRV